MSGFDTVNWKRYGNGKSFAFYIAPEEVEDIFKNELLPIFEPYHVYEIRIVEIEKHKNEYQVGIYELDEFQFLTGEEWAIFYFQSKKISDEISLENVDNKDLHLCLNGLINFMCGRKNRYKKTLPLDISMLNKIVNVNTLKIIHHVEYEKLFNRIKRQIKKRLCYKTIFEYPDGTSMESDIMMSEAYVSLYNDNKVNPSSKPGKKIK